MNRAAGEVLLKQKLQERGLWTTYVLLLKRNRYAEALKMTEAIIAECRPEFDEVTGVRG